MKRLYTFLFFSAICLSAFCQKKPAKPKLVIGIIVDQMRWDYLYRYYNLYEKNGGFRRLLKDGFLCENTMINYTPSFTACGHSAVYTGSVPAINGIVSNTWWDKEQNKFLYCTEDKKVNSVGSNSASGMQSPVNLLTTTIGDELRLATNFTSKVIGIALKDRGAILPAGHSANAAYWYDNITGDWISSSYYMENLPGWVSALNKQKLPDKYYQQGWNLLYAPSFYTQSTTDDKAYESKILGTIFPYDLKTFIGKDYSKLLTTPMGNSLTLEMAKAAIAAEQLGADSITDMLTISFSSTDYIGHSFGPNSVEEEDCFLRLDKELGSFFDFLDNKIGKQQYLLFLTADHGAAHVPEFMQEHKLPAGRFFIGDITKQLNKSFADSFKIGDIVFSNENFQLFLNQHLIDSAKLDRQFISAWIVNYLYHVPGIDKVIPFEDLNCIPLPNRIRAMLNNGYYPKRCGDFQLILKPGYIEAWNQYGTSHGLWNPYDTHIPLIWYGWHIKKGETSRELSITDIAPTVSTLLKIQMPSGNIGNVITEVLK